MMRGVLNALLPDGSAWRPVVDGDMDNLFEGIAENLNYIKIQTGYIRYFRDPMNTTILSDLETEYGILPGPLATDAQRRSRLRATMFQRGTLPTYELLEMKLQEAGFDVKVHANSPAVDPATFITQAFQMTAGDTLPGGNDAQAGEPEAYCGQIGGYLLVNGDIFLQSPNYTILCDEALAQCGEDMAFAGQYDSINLVPIEYDIPVIAGYWPLIFFVGGDATRDPVTGAITSIDIAPVPIQRQSEFKRIILQYKPLFSWAALVVVWS